MKNTIVNLGENCYVIQSKCNHNNCDECTELCEPDKLKSLFE